MNAASMARKEQRPPPRLSPSGQTRADDAFTRRAAALRRNLHRRKDQQKNRRNTEPDTAEWTEK